jgi:hypothetical protein
MPRTKSGSLSTYRLYKQTGQALVTTNGQESAFDVGSATDIAARARACLPSIPKGGACEPIQ